jgi:hypothetical protein
MKDEQLVIGQIMNLREGYTITGAREVLRCADSVLMNTQVVKPISDVKMPDSVFSAHQESRES